eukprot:COSAG06_NODE_221_length_19912_cov_17.460875_15_plen_80_part_00
MAVCWFLGRCVGDGEAVLAELSSELPQICDDASSRLRGANTARLLRLSIRTQTISSSTQQMKVMRAASRSVTLAGRSWV